MRSDALALRGKAKVIPEVRAGAHMLGYPLEVAAISRRRIAGGDVILEAS
ncbi:MAG: hypothetical protein ACPGSC_08315 [Granulosicoccaceae bacterium]